MNAKTKKAIMTAVKLLFWTGVAAAAQAGINAVTGFGLPEFSIPFIAAGLKALATYAATEASEAK